mgnify:CR=1 FL=1
MNKYDDYAKYIEEKRPFLNEIKYNAVNVYVLFEDIIEVLDYLIKMYQKEGKIDEDLIDFFDVGFGYLTSVITDIEMMYNEYFHKNIEMLNAYSNLIIYFFFVEDLKCHFDANEVLTESKKKTIDSIQKEIEEIFAKNLPISDEITEKFEVKIDKMFTKSDNFHPIYSIFAMVREELNIF